MLARETVELLIQAARAAQAARNACDLGPAEWMALRFFARANAQSRKPSDLADFEASSRAAVSHVIGRLEHGGYVERKPSPEDRRSYCVEVTAKGLAMLSDDPIEALVQSVRSLPEDSRDALHDALQSVLTGLAVSGTRRQFNTCRDCAYLIAAQAGETESSDRVLECDLFHVALDHGATQQLCARFRPATVPGSSTSGERAAG